MTLVRDFAALRPAGGFHLIMADPPWAYQLYSEKGQAKAPQAQYACTPLDWIKSMPVSVLAADDCLLWLWATNPMLPQAIEVVSAWGFAFKTAGHWVKRTKHGKMAFGTGYLLRCAGEPFLLATRGAPKTARNVRSVVEGQIREHSRKPEEAYAAAEALMPEARRLELFSRTDRAGWSVWGNETGKFAVAA
ncbi:DNA methyltransferase [Rhodovulum sulfidophilum]|uniref:DNA methyltransferase n=2 Tax=Rhodovulum TaxID=34008 RepID=A0ABS1RGW6_9RHOB|nr:MT-A70 family methyltransferase [Rhodovulum visakhapatnamense]MBL3569923.1 DNA methyltransferase [Rhodovulum visakhapatnamense]MBL3578384.1 DNA methyltransferase [Rhodovulum visakhapatnamense]OLS43075.1 DNA methyltransferase [Rhodovulum sulfidophilum]